MPYIINPRSKERVCVCATVVFDSAVVVGWSFPSSVLPFLSHGLTLSLSLSLSLTLSLPLPPSPSLSLPHFSLPQVKMSRMRQRIAQRLKEAQNVNAMLTTFNEVDMRSDNIHSLVI